MLTSTRGHKLHSLYRNTDSPDPFIHVKTLRNKITSQCPNNRAKNHWLKTMTRSNKFINHLKSIYMKFPFKFSCPMPLSSLNKKSYILLNMAYRINSLHMDDEHKCMSFKGNNLDSKIIPRFNKFNSQILSKVQRSRLAHKLHGSEQGF